MIIPSDAVLHTAEILALRHQASAAYRKVTRLYTAYLRGIDRLPRGRVVDKRYLYDELERGRVTSLAINCDHHLRLVGYTTGSIITYPDMLLLCTDLVLTSGKWRSDRKVASVRRALLRQACLRYATQHHLVYDLSERQRLRQNVMWRSPCGSAFANYQLQGTRLVRH